MNARHLSTVVCVFAIVTLTQTPNTCTAIAETPSLSDRRLKLSLFAEDPDIVTPIGMAIDNSDRVFVVESHTHHPPDGYKGHDSDRIKVFVDQDNDGDADQVTVFADGIHQAMNLAFSPSGDLYVVCAREVLRLVDENQDGVCDRKEQILSLKTKQRYAHNCLLSITFDRNDWMYIGRGNVGSDAYRLIGQDDSFVEGFGDGGNVVRCRPNGTQLSEFATGFWNPFDLKFDRSGRLLMVDNDPDARGPNRLLEVVRGGDYGYKSMFGGEGTHPFQGWDGSLPGTLPYISGTGEAPSGLVDCRLSSLPESYRNSVLATIWNENSIEQFDFHPASGVLSGKSTFLKGEQDFRPVAISCDSRGNLFVTDWVLVDYPNHGRGRIWRISTKDLRQNSAIDPEGYFDSYHITESQNRRKKIAGMDSVDLVQAVSNHSDFDPYCRHHVVSRLATQSQSAARIQCFDGDDSQRMSALLAHKRAEFRDVRRIEKLLTDQNPEIRRAALMWAGQTMDLGLAPKLENALKTQPVTPAMFEMYLAATEVLTDDFVDAYHRQSTGKANRLPRILDPSLILDVASNESLSPRVRGLAVRRLGDPSSPGQVNLLKLMLRSDHDELTVAAIETISQLGLSNDHKDQFLMIAADPRGSARVRTEAISALQEIGGFDPMKIVPLVNDSSIQVAIQAKRAVANLSPPGKGSAKPAATTSEELRNDVMTGGDAMLGRHVFFSSRIGCSKCHNMNGRGGTLGPGLEGLARSKSKAQIVDAILDPSAEFAPQYQAWMVLTDEGSVYRGIQLDHKSKGAIVLTLESGENRYFKADEIEAYRALPTSLMPSGLAELMTREEFRDLVAYLATLNE